MARRSPVPNLAKAGKRETHRAVRLFAWNGEWDMPRSSASRRKGCGGAGSFALPESPAKLYRIQRKYFMEMGTASWYSVCDVENKLI